MSRPTPSQFDELVHEHHAAVYRSALRICERDDAAADVAQDVFLRVLRGKVRLAAAESVRATLCWLATRLAHNAVRSTRRRARHEEYAMQESAHTVDPGRAVADADVLRTVTTLVARLPADLRLPVQLRCQDELTFEAIGSALAISESTAHDRFERAIAKLRGWLRGGGFAVAGLPIGQLVADMEAPVLPRGLEGRLLALGKASALATASIARRVVVFSIAGTLAVAVTLASTVGGANEPAPPAEVAAVVPVHADQPVAEPPSTERRAVPAPTPAERGDAQPDAAPAPDLLGSVHDAAKFAVVGATVRLVAGGGLKPFGLGETKTGEGGAFRLKVQRDRWVGIPKKVKLQVHEGTALLLQTADFDIPRPADAAPMVLVLPESAGTEVTRFTLAVTVLDGRGRPVAGVPVKLFAEGAGKRPRPGGRGEVEATTDGNGIATLKGRVPGGKWLFVDPREQGNATSYTAYTVAGPGSHDTAVRVASGATLHGTVTALDGSSLKHLSLWLEDGDGVQHPRKVAADGSVRFTGLGSGEHTLHTRGWPFSPVAIKGLRAAAEPFHVELKRNDDARDHGDHMGELHGRLVDAESGEEISWGAFDVEVFRCSDDSGSTLLTDGCPPPPPVQRAAGSNLLEEFHETGLDAGTWVIVARVDGYAATAFSVTLRDNELKNELRVPLQRGAELHGRVLDAAGQPLAGATVRIVGVGELADRNLAEFEESQQWSSVSLCSARTGRDGTFVMRGVPTGTAVRLTGYKKGHPMIVQAPNVYRARAEVSGLELRLR